MSKGVAVKMRRLFAIILAAVTIVSTVPVNAYAAEMDTTVVAEVTDEEANTPTEDLDASETGDEEGLLDSEDEVSETEDQIAGDGEEDSAIDLTEDEITEDIEDEISDEDVVSDIKTGYCDIVDGLYQCGSFDVSAAFSGSDEYAVLATSSQLDSARKALYNGLKAKKAAIDLYSYNITTSQAADFYYGTVNEYPELYYVVTGFGWSYDNNNIVTEIRPTYLNTGFNDAYFQDAVEAALSVVNDDMSELEKAIALHDYLVTNTTYDYTVAHGGKGSGNIWNTYGILVEQNGVCQGYALTYKMLLNKVGITAYYVSSQTMNHAWNVVVLDGQNYYVDCTWDDPTDDLIGRCRHAYMFLSESTFRADDSNVSRRAHTGSDWKVYVNGVVTKITANSTTYDNQYWNQVNSAFANIYGWWFYAAKTDSYNNNIYYTNDISTDGTSWISLGRWNNWIGAFAGIFTVNNILYYNQYDGIYAVDPFDESGEVNPTYLKSENNVYGVAYVYNPQVESHQVLMEVRSNLNNDGTTYTFNPSDLGIAEQLRTYSISYETNGGVLPDDVVKSYTREDKVTLPVLADKSGYSFAGWYTTSTFSGSAVTEIAAGSTGNKTFYAKWTPKKPNNPSIRVQDDDKVDYEDGVLINSGTKIVLDLSGTEDDDVVLYYTLTGADPTKSSTKYTAPFALTATKTVKVIACRGTVYSDVVSLKVYVSSNSFTLNKTTISVAENSTFQLSATALPTSRTESDIVWTVDDDSVAKVSADGLVTGVYEGSTTVHATVKDWNNNDITKDCKVTVTPQKFSVVFYGITKNVLVTRTVNARTAAIAPTAPAVAGYTFEKWDKDYSYVTSNLEVYAVYNPIEYSITYNYNGGSVVVDALSVYTIESEDVILPTTSVKAGYDFAGWYTTAALTGTPTTRISKGSTGNKVFYAKWTPEKPSAVQLTADDYMNLENGDILVDYGANVSMSLTGNTDNVTIYYTTNGTTPTARSSVYSTPITINETTVFNAIAIREGVASDVVTQKFVVAENEFRIDISQKTLQRTRQQKINVTLMPSSKTAEDIVWSSSDENVATVNSEGVVTGVNKGTATITAKVSDWKGNVKTCECTFTIVLAKYNVVFYGFGGIKVGNAVVDEGCGTTAPVIPEEITGYRFIKWDKEFDVINEDLNINAVYELYEYTITYHGNGGSVEGVTPVKYNYETNEITLMEPGQRAGFVFAGWYDNAEFEGSPVKYITSHSTGDKEFYAKWKNEKELWMKWKGLEENEDLSVQYTGAAIKPEYEVYYGDKLLTYGTEYIATFKNNLNVNATGDARYAATLVITGRGNYAGKVEKTFTITPKSIKDIDVDITNVTLNYTGRKQTKAPSVTWNGKVVPAKDLTITYPTEGEGAYTEVGTYTIKVTAKGNYKDYKYVDLQIIKQDPKDADADILMSRCKAVITNFAYTGNEIDFSTEADLSHVKVSMGSTVLEYGTDYILKYGTAYNGIACKDIGTYTVAVIGQGKYKGEIKAKFNITGTSITTMKFTAIPNEIYDGTAKTPVPVITDREGNVLTNGTDYMVLSYEKNVDAGVAKVVIAGIGKYNNKVTKTFRITQLPLNTISDSDLSIMFANGTDAIPFAKGGTKPKLVIKYKGALLTEGVDYALAYRNSAVLTTDPNKMPEIIVTGKKNFNNKVSVNFNVVKADISELKITVPDIMESTVAGKYMSNPVITDKNGRNLAKNVDYEATFIYRDQAGNILDKNSKPAAGSVITVEVTGKNSYENSIVGSYRVFAKGYSVAAATVKVKPESANKLIYDGNPVTLTKDDLTVQIGRTTVLTADDYEIVESSYTNNTNKGVAKVTIVGKGQYAGSKTISFTVKANTLTWWNK